MLKCEQGVSLLWKIFLTLSLPRVINFKFPLQPHQKYNITQYGELGFSWLTQMKDDYATNFHHILLDNTCFNLGVKALMIFAITQRVSHRLGLH